MAELRITVPEPHARALVRVRVPLAAASQAASAAGLPSEPLSSVGGDRAALWLGPDQWLLVSRTRPVESLLADVGAQLAGALHHATDASDALALVLVEGGAARAVLGMLSGIDFHASAFPPGRCVRTRFAKVAAVIHAVGEDAFELYVDRSVADYVADWLRHCATDPLLTG